MQTPSVETVGAAVRDLLRAHGPLSEDQLLDRLVESGIAGDGPDLEDLLADALDEDEELLLPLADERWAWLPGLLDGRVFTHRLGAPEVAHDFLEVGTDLFPLSMLTEIDTYQRLVTGAPIVDAMPAFDAEILDERGVPAAAIEGEAVWLLEPGTFSALGARVGDLLGVRVTPEGFELTVVDEAAPCGVGAALTDLLADSPDEPAMLDTAVWTVCAADDTLFCRAAAPLAELLTESGLACEGDWLAPGGFDFAGWRLARRIEAIKDRHQLGDDEALAVLAAMALYDRTAELVEHVMAAEHEDEDELSELVAQPIPRSDPVQAERRPEDEDTTVRASLRLLAEPAVAAAVLAETDGDDDQGAVALGIFAETAEPLAPLSARPALRWLRAQAHERLGDFRQAEECLQGAESLDASWPLTLLSLARYASDRGDAERGLALLRRAGAPPDDDLVVLLEHFRATPRRDLGRNDRCWCGSGRKYKVCHLNREQLPLEERAAWLYQKATATLLDGSFAALLIETALARASHRDGPDALGEALSDGLVSDTVLFEGGAFAEFLATRGWLLPDDERLLAEQWLLAERSVHEVVAVSRGHGLTMRDVRTGDVHEVRERAGSQQVKVGQYLCARVVPAGETMQIFGGLEPVTLAERDGLIALLDNGPGPVELVTALSRRFAPPVLHNTEGEPILLCEATLRVGNPGALARALDDTYDRADSEQEDTLLWFEHVLTHGMQRIRAQLELTGDQLHIHANSANRFDRVLDVVRTLDPSAHVLTETRETADDLRAVRRRAARNPVAPQETFDPASDPAVVALLNDMARKHEAAWLDEQIPALAAFTPRQCAEDPTRRPDLIRLLDSFPEDTGQPGAMSPARLRAALGLD